MILMEEALSEGEIVSDEGPENETGESLEPAPVKKPKLDPGVGETSDGSVLPKTAPALKHQSPKRKKKSKLRKSEQKRSKERQSHDSGCRDSSRITAGLATGKFLPGKSGEIMKRLVQLSEGEVLDASSAPPTIKTILFQSIILNLVLGSSSAGTRSGGDAEGMERLRENRVVVVWMSLVSANIFASSDRHFKKMKSLHPCFRFNIQHPGSPRFVKLGLEAFMMNVDSEDGEKATLPPAAPAAEFTRADCLLSLKELLNNEYPGSEEGKDMSEFTRLAEWPRADSSLSEAGSFPLFALDCEMVETEAGDELAKVSLVDEMLDCVYDSLVQPSSPVVDYRTKFSGISKDKLKDITTTLTDVQQAIRKILPSKCILIGHSLENDLRALKLAHPYVIDTSCLFTPFASPLSKPSLRMLAKKLLDADIQTASDGHDSIEDASTCMKLVQLKLKQGPKCTVPWNDSTKSILADIAFRNRSSGIVDKQGVANLFGRAATHCCIADTDNAVIKVAKTVIPKCDFTFLQLHAMESFLKSAQRDDKEKLLEVADALDSHVMDLVEHCPSKTLVFVVCGSNDITEVKQLQQQRWTDFGKLKEVVMVARTGQVLAFIVN